MAALKLSPEDEEIDGNEESCREAGLRGKDDQGPDCVRVMAEKLAVEPKQIQSFFEALAELATEQLAKRASSRFLVEASWSKQSARNAWAAI